MLTLFSVHVCRHRKQCQQCRKMTSFFSFYVKQTIHLHFEAFSYFWWFPLMYAYRHFLMHCLYTRYLGYYIFFAGVIICELVHSNSSLLCKYHNYHSFDYSWYFYKLEVNRWRVSLEKFGLFFYICLFFNINWSLILLVFFTLPDTVSWTVFLIIRWHPLIWLQYSAVHFGEHQPPHLGPNLPGGQDLLQNGPKYPAVHSA